MWLIGHHDSFSLLCSFGTEMPLQRPSKEGRSTWLQTLAVRLNVIQHSNDRVKPVVCLPGRVAEDPLLNPERRVTVPEGVANGPRDSRAGNSFGVLQLTHQEVVIPEGANVGLYGILKHGLGNALAHVL